MIDLCISETDWTALRKTLLTGEVERCAVMYATQSVRSNNAVRLLVREIVLPADIDYASQGVDGAILRPEFVARVTKEARRADRSLVFVHTHPGVLKPQFSPTDDVGEQALKGFLGHRHSNVPHAAMVLSRGGARARTLGSTEELRVISIGEFRTVEFDPSARELQVPERFDRQVRAFGEAGQKAIQELRIGIVGVGGTGSIVAQQLAHLGVQKFVLLDPDVIEPSNLNRVVGARASDISRWKVRVAARLIKSVAPSAQINAVKGDVIRARDARSLLDADLVFGCTDSHGSRAVLQQVAYQYLIPCIDLGTTISSSLGAVTGIFGRVQMVTPGLPCFSCSDLLDPEEVRRDMMSAFERKLDPYIPGAQEPAPAVISINGVVASLAVTMFMSYVTGLPIGARYVLYNGIKTSLRSVRSSQRENCYICSISGVLARGDSHELYARQD